MKLTKQFIKQVIKEELDKLSEAIGGVQVHLGGATYHVEKTGPDEYNINFEDEDGNLSNLDQKKNPRLVDQIIRQYTQISNEMGAEDYYRFNS